MKPHLILTTIWLGCATILTAADEQLPVEERKAKHKEGATEVADAQDELSADVQQLVIEQTMPKVIELLNQVESIMDEATDRLADADTGGATIAAQTEVIEKIYDAAKERQKQSQGQGQGSKPGSAMMDMMERMMGKQPGNQPGQGKGKDKPGDKGGEGQTGLSDSANDTTTGNGGGKSEARRIPKAAGNASHEIPDEFKQAFDAYNRGAEKKVK